MAHDEQHAAKVCVFAIAAALMLCAGTTAALAETQSVIDPVDAPEPRKPPAPAIRQAPQPDASAKRERQRAQEEQRKRAAADRAQAAEAEAARARAAQQAQRAKAAREAAAARAAAARAQAVRIAKVRLAAQKEAARKEALRQAAAREAATRQAAAKEAAMREAAARETAAREAAAREAVAREAAARETALREAAAREAAMRETAAREAAAREVAAREAAVREAAAREAAAKEAAAREAAARLAAADTRPQPRPWPVFRDCTDCPEVVWLPQGEMLLGQQDAAGGPRYVARMSYPLAVGRFKVSFAEWDACVVDGGCRRRPDDAGWGRGRQPVINVSWEDAQQYTAWLSRRTSKRYRLLTGAEWEYAARAGPDVHDMQGGVSEWVENCYQYRDARNGGKMWTLECTNQVVRGGAAQGAAGMTRVARSFAPFNYHDSRIGFRVARTE